MSKVGAVGWVGITFSAIAVAEIWMVDCRDWAWAAGIWPLAPDTGEGSIKTESNDTHWPDEQRS